MATIIHLSSDRSIQLSSTTLVGRASGCAVCLTNPLVSGEHASFRWTGSHWELRDCGSRNGTFVGPRRLESREAVAIAVGDRVAFGDTEDTFEVTDVSPPGAGARADDGELRVSEGGLLVLPADDNPELTIFFDGAWFVEDAEGERKAVTNGARLQCGGRRWQLELPTVLARTMDADALPLRLAAIGLQFRVSSNEEHIELTLTHGGQRKLLPARAHSYLLLTLARARLADRDAPAPEAEHGWVYVEDLVEMLKTNENQLNVAIYRARRQLAMADVEGATELIERRPGSRQIRLGVRDLEITML